MPIPPEFVAGWTDDPIPNAVVVYPDPARPDWSRLALYDAHGAPIFEGAIRREAFDEATVRALYGIVDAHAGRALRLVG